MSTSFERGARYGLVRALMTVARVLPRSVGLRVFGTLGAVAVRLFGKDRMTTELNLSMAFPERGRKEIRVLARKVWTNLGRNCVDALRLPGVECEELDSFVKVLGMPLFEEALSRGRGVVAVTGHIGNWELLAAYFSMKGYPLSVLARPLRDEGFERILDRLRRAKGMRPISRLTTVRAAYRCLTEGGVLGVLIDQDTAVKGVFCDFFGRPAYTAVGPAHLALRTGAAIVPTGIHLGPDGTHVITVKESIEICETGDTEADVLVITQRCSDAVEELVRLDVTQWVWMHERWKTRPLIS
ncbi:MAG: lysophospholipid acyltransferase family protein [Candidatus Eisenbacteria bacterium]